MSVRPIIDAGPGLNFLSANKERLLISVIGPFSAPETVQAEAVAAESGQAVTILIDDGPAARIATTEIMRLKRLRSAGFAVGSIRLASTLTVLERAAGTGQLPGRAEMRDTYTRLRALDDGLPPIETTRLLAPALWGRTGQLA